MGEVAAFGPCCAPSWPAMPRDPRLRVAAAAVAAPLGLGLYVQFSRGALFALRAGLVDPRRRRRRDASGCAARLVAVVPRSLAAAGAPVRGVTVGVRQPSHARARGPWC